MRVFKPRTFRASALEDFIVMLSRLVRSAFYCSAVLVALAATAQNDRPFDRTVDLVYTTIDGKDFYMDIFVPNGKAANPALKPGEGGKGLGLVDIGSGAWHSDRGKLNDHEAAKMYDIFTARGYTVFAARPGDRDEYTCFDMVKHVKTAIRWVKANAAKYNIDPNRLGLCGASAGGHLALMTILTPEAADPKASDPLLHFSTDVTAAGIFFPPTDFTNWGSEKDPKIEDAIGDILFKGGGNGHTPEEIAAKAKEASPIFYLKGKTIPIRLFHGDADPLVPLSQSQRLVDKLKSFGSDIEFTIVPGGGHPWPTIPLDVLKMADWFDSRLGKAK